MVDGVSGSVGLIDAEGLDGLLCFLIGEENHVRREREPHQIVKYCCPVKLVLNKTN